MAVDTLANEAVMQALEAQAAPTAKPGILSDWWANPGVIGLMGFSLTTIVTGLFHALGLGSGSAVALAVAFGGTAQFIAGWVDLRKGSIFAGSAFVGYGAFWWTFAMVSWAFPAMGVDISEGGKLAFFIAWTLFTFSFSIAVVKVGKFLTALFWLLLLAFILLDGVVLGIVPESLAGWEIVLTGLVAWYIATATLVNTVHGKEVLPIS